MLRDTDFYRGLMILIVSLGLLGCLTKKTPSEAGYQPCSTVACGEVCSPCADDDPDCIAPGIVTVCDARGQCVPKGNGATLCDPDDCVPGSTFESADGCNSCQCPASGSRGDAACTTRACNTDECTPGSRFDAPDGCNICVCPESGQRSEAACTERTCAELCEPGTQFAAADGCNVCQCPENGRRDQAACTERGCASPCAGLTCGDPCQPSEIADRAPANGGEGAGGSSGAAPARPEFLCNVLGQCVPSSDEALHCGERCYQRACGDLCRASNERFSGGDDGDGERRPGSGSGGAPPEGAEELRLPEFCNHDGLCVSVNDPQELMCPEPPSPCDDLACGDPCDQTRGTRAGPEGDREETPGAEPVSPAPPPTLCNAAGECVLVQDVRDLMCMEPETCEPGTQVQAPDGCNTCTCPASGRASDAVDCTEAVCAHPDCEDAQCGALCDPDRGRTDRPGDEQGGSSGAPIQFLCNADRQCVLETEELDCAE